MSYRVWNLRRDWQTLPVDEVLAELEGCDPRGLAENILMTEIAGLNELVGLLALTSGAKTDAEASSRAAKALSQIGTAIAAEGIWRSPEGEVAVIPH